MATTNFRENYLGCDLIAPTVNSLDNLGRATTSTADYMGRPLRRILRANTTAVTLNQELQFTGGEKFIVTIAGTTAASPPAAPAVGARWRLRLAGMSGRRAMANRCRSSFRRVRRQRRPR